MRRKEEGGERIGEREREQQGQREREQNKTGGPAERTSGDSAPQREEKEEKKKEGTSFASNGASSRGRSIVHHRAQATAPQCTSVWRRSGGPSASEAARKKREKDFPFPPPPHMRRSPPEGVAFLWRHAIDSRSVRVRGASSVSSSHAKVRSGAARYQIHRPKGSRKTDRPCRKARGFAKAQRFFFSLFSFSFELNSSLSGFPLFSLSLFPFFFSIPLFSNAPKW